MVYRVPVVSRVQARAYLIFKSTPLDGDTVVVGEQTYTFRDTLALPFDVKINSTEGSAHNFADALTFDSTEGTNEGTSYGDATSNNISVHYDLPNTTPLPGLVAPTVTTTISPSFFAVIVGAPDFGAAYNLVKVSESTSGARLAWYTNGITNTSTTTYLGGTNPSFSNQITGDAAWLEFDDPDTNVTRSPVVDDTFNRYYFASPSLPPQYNTYDRIITGADPWLLGVPPPGCVLGVSVVGGGNAVTLGNTTLNGNTRAGVPNYIYLVKVRPTGATSAQSVTFTLFATDEQNPSDGYPEGHYAAVVYSDTGGVPDVLLGTGAIVTGITRDIDNVSSFVNPIALDGNTDYWAGFLIDTLVTFNGGPAEVAANVASFSNTFTNGPPATVPSNVDLGQFGIQMWLAGSSDDVLESRAYVYTWVSEYGEEGPPSPPALLDGWSNGTWTLDLWSPPADDLGILRNLKKLNIYRTVPGQGGTTVFFFVESVDIGTLQYVDTKPSSEVALNDELVSTNWFPPPSSLQGFTVMGNGMIAAFTGNEIWFCEPFRPHAWPPGYVLTVDFPIVGMGMTNGSLVVCTAARPYVITGPSPDRLVQAQCSHPFPCSSRASILSGDSAVSYMSPNGLIQVTAAGVATNTTDLWFTREQWQQLVPQQYGRAIYLASCYYCLGSVSPDGGDSSFADRGFTIELDQDNTSFTIWPQPGGHRLGFNVLDTPTGFGIQNVLNDPWTGIGLIVSNGSVWYFDFSDAEPEMLPYVWQSKLYQQNAKRNYQAMKVFFTVPVNTPTQNPTRIEEVASHSVWDELPTDSYGFIKTYVDVDGTGDMSLIDAREIRRSGELLRIVDGFKADQWFWQIEGRVIISNVQIATSVKDLANI